MNPRIGPDHTPLAAASTLASRFDKEFKKFQLGRRDTTEEYSRSNGTTAHFASFGRKLDKLFEMPGSESGDTTHNTTGSVAENGNSTHHQQNPLAQASGCNQQLMEMLKQQSEALLSCMQEIGNLKRESNTVQGSGFRLRADKGGYGAVMKQQQSESFEDYYAETHDLTFRLRRKIPEPELIKTMKSNVKPSLATLIFATKVESVAELKAECKRAEKMLKGNRTRPRHVNEVGQEGEPSREAHSQTVEAFAPRHEQASNNHFQERRQFQPATSRTGHPKQTAAPAGTPLEQHTLRQTRGVAINATPNSSFCQSPFHLTMCYVCGMPGDFFLKNPAENAREGRCRCPFHNMICFVCGKNESYCPLPPSENPRLARQTGNPGQTRHHPGQQQ
uniref:Retrotransposon gag domain-containing protein n=1 Tax=Glossina morsitans morsitans TaxID=37546 RepID=A0A1B0GEZ4_GLOMM